jgi:transcriptional regulator with XRE-family HTH domain
MDVCTVIKLRLEELGLEQRDLAAAAQVTESYISQLLTGRKAPPSIERTDLYERMNAFLKLPKGQLSAMADVQRREALRKKLSDPPVPLCKEARALIIRKCRAEHQGQMRTIFETHSFGELERVITQTILDVSKRVARDELRNEHWLRSIAQPTERTYEEIRATILEFLDTDVFNISPEQCSAFLDQLIDSWGMDLAAFAMDITLNPRLTSLRSVKFQFVELSSHRSVAEETGLKNFLRDPSLSGDATEEEIEFLKSLTFKSRRPGALYYYRELQNLRDPLHFSDRSDSAMPKRRDSDCAGKQQQVNSRENALRRWAKNDVPSKQKAKGKSSLGPGSKGAGIN